MADIHYRNLENKEEVLFGTFWSIFQFFWTKIMRTKVILRIISEAFMYEFSKMNGMAVGTSTITPESVISQGGGSHVSKLPMFA